MFEVAFNYCTLLLYKDDDVDSVEHFKPRRAEIDTTTINNCKILGSGEQSKIVSSRITPESMVESQKNSSPT
jgi:hypothetical protein